MMMTLIAFVLTIQSSLTSQSGSAEWHPYSVDKYFALVLSEADLADNPQWRADADDPPLSARAAIRAAKLLRPQPNLNPDDWRVQAVTLRQVRPPDGWVYVVELQWTPNCSPAPNTRCEPLTFDVIVLMNGRAVAPRFALKTP